MITLLEKFTYSILLIVVVLGVYFGLTDDLFFSNVYVREDGILENATALILFFCGLLAIWRIIKAKGRTKTWFYISNIFVALAFIFVAGEEISWGQRIFGVESSEFFTENNAQGETNLHNLVVNDVKVNKLLFGQILTSIIVIYLIVFPILYRFWSSFRLLIDRLHIPIPKTHHSLAYVVLTVLIMIIPSGKKWELLELGSAAIFFLILLKPFNEHIYAPEL